MIGLATAKDTPAAITTPKSVINVVPFGAIDKKAIMEPGLAGPFKPHSNIE